MFFFKVIAYYEKYMYGFMKDAGRNIISNKAKIVHNLFGKFVNSTYVCIQS